MALMNLRLDFLFADLFQHFRIYLVIFTLTEVFYSWAWVRGNAKSFVL